MCILKDVGCKNGTTPADQLMNSIRNTIMNVKRMQAQRSFRSNPSNRSQLLTSNRSQLLRRAVELRSDAARSSPGYDDCKGMVMLDSADQSFGYEFPSEHTSMRLRHNGTETWFMSTSRDVPTPLHPANLTAEQSANVLTLLTSTSTFEIEFAFAEPKYDPFRLDPHGCPASGGRNILFEAFALPECPSPPPAPPAPPPQPPHTPDPPVTRQFSWRWWHDGDSPDIASWDSVVRTCEERAGRLCRYKEICPKGPGHQPNGGIQKEHEVAFSPYARADAAHDYVFIGLNGTCESLLDKHGPDEVDRIKGVERELTIEHAVSLPASEVKEDFLCCSGDEGGYDSYPFMRWLHIGQHFTWQQAEEHCQNAPAEFPTLGYPMRMCYYNELCPWGEMHPPQGSYPAEESLWAPYRRTDGVNGGLDYASVGTGVDGPCRQLANVMSPGNATELSKEPHEMKRFIACCA